ncbi:MULTISPECIES: hypothetical protein [unclassified Pseudomonas]|uniref:hypothetical protein n=1 Tax=unclassified Pseudomonas TaxID=196821 RepID=UPI0015A25B42|nr:MULTISPECIES: hypothetical protein [unclassified Pseudomonas]NWC95753.1 hypothetical protein [Pseudomonas sp. IPO3779]NWD15331.1 hypothetical protein [Pseudomonas sp. IPO3778]
MNIYLSVEQALSYTRNCYKKTSVKSKKTGAWTDAPNLKHPLRKATLHALGKGSSS